MPRNPHPAPESGHSQAHIRESRSRHIRRRWKRNKVLYTQEEANGTVIINLSKRSVRRRLSAETLEALPAALGQAGPVVHLHPEALRRLDKPLRLELEHGLGLHIAGRNELAEGASSVDRATKAAHRAQQASKPKRSRARDKRVWGREVEAEAFT